VLRLGIGEAPDFIALDALRRHAPHLFIMEGVADVASINQKLRNRVDRNPRDPADRSHGRSFNQHGEDLDASGDGQLVHASDIRRLNQNIKQFYQFE
jgi:hypothetical protein